MIRPNARQIDDALESLRAIVQFAYDMGFHELGYDPVKCLEWALAQGSGTPQDKAEAK